MFSSLPLPALPILPNKLISEPWLGSVGEGEWEWDPSADHPSDVGESHFRGGLLEIKYE